MTLLLGLLLQLLHLSRRCRHLHLHNDLLDLKCHCYSFLHRHRHRHDLQYHCLQLTDLYFLDYVNRQLQRYLLHFHQYGHRRLRHLHKIQMSQR